MRQARPGRPRRGMRPPHLVVLSKLLAHQPPAIPREHRDALVNGLRYVQLIERLFPDEAIGLRQRTTRFETLLGVFGMFLSLVHTRLLTLDLNAYRLSYGGYMNFARIPTNSENPSQALYHWSGAATSRRLLANEGAAWLETPIPRVYGIDPDDLAEVTPNGLWQERNIYGHALTLAIWRLLGATPWSLLPGDQVSEIAARRCHNPTLGETIAVLPQIAYDTPLPALCAWLDRQPGIPKRLGSLIAFACQRTENPFADRTTAEVRPQQLGQASIIPIRWDISLAAFSDLRADQEQAASFWRSYRQLSGRLLRDRDLLVAIRRAVLAGVDTVAGEPNGMRFYNPRALIWNLQ